MVKKEQREREKREERKITVEPIEKEKVEALEKKEIEEEKKEAGEKEEAVEEEKRVIEEKERRLSREEKEKLAKAEALAVWKPRTRLGKEVKEGKIKNIDEIFEKGLKILEAEIVDSLIPSLKAELLIIGQAKGKFGGGKGRFWRQTQRKTAEGNVPSFVCMAAVGDMNGYIGLGAGKARETLPAKEKALRAAKLSLLKIRRGCGSFDCSCKENHSIPFTVEGKSSSSKIRLMPAPKGTGLVIEDECKKIMKLAGIKDVYSRAFGQTRTKINLAQACFEALKQTLEIK